MSNVFGIDNKYLDKLLGSLLGHAIGDCLGMPHEFCRKKGQGLHEYSPVIIPTTHFSRFQGKKTSALGQGSDDTEMAMCLLAAIGENNGSYDSESAIERYLAFAKASSFLGANTRALFKGVTTVRGYRQRYGKAFGDGTEATQSNGFLMRAAPLVILSLTTPEFHEEAILQDQALTNPGPVNAGMAFIYGKILARAVHGLDIDEEFFAELVDEALVRWPDFKTVAETLVGEVPDVSGPSKGWARHALHIALVCAFDTHTSFEDGIRKVILCGGDTDTNGAICGAILGARYGLVKMLKEETTSENIKLVLESDCTQGDYLRSPDMTVHLLKIMFPVLKEIEKELDR